MKRSVVAVLVFSVLFTGCTTVRVETASGTNIYYRNPILSEKHMLVTLPDGTTYKFDSEADPVVELASQLSAMAKLVASQGAKP